jgi:PncC family amidohydrolase
MKFKYEIMIGDLLDKRKLTIATAESCTGGLISHLITNVPGSSKYFERGLIVYSNDAKMELLNVQKETIEKYGAVSSETASEMAEGIKSSARTDLGLAVTGIAGPSGGTPDKPVGLVYIALAADQGINVQKFQFDGEREDVKIQTAETALAMLLDHLIK